MTKRGRTVVKFSRRVETFLGIYPDINLLIFFCDLFQLVLSDVEISV